MEQSVSHVIGSDSIGKPGLAEALERVGDADLLRELVAIFTAEACADLEALRRAVKRRDTAMLAGVAHSLKGALRTLGAEPAARTAEWLERVARERQLDCAVPLVALLCQEVEDFVRVASTWFGAP